MPPNYTNPAGASRLPSLRPVRRVAELVRPLMIIARNKAFGAIYAALLTAIAVVICCCVPRERSYAGKPVSLWCDYLPFTDQMPAALGGSFARMYRSSTNQAEQARFRDLEKQALLAINTLGTNCLPELLSRLRQEYSSMQFESRKLAAKVGFIKRTEVGIWHMGPCKNNFRR